MFVDPIIDPQEKPPAGIEICLSGEEIKTGGVVEIKLDAPLRPHWLDAGEKIALPLQGLRKSEPDKNTKAWAIINNSKLPLISTAPDEKCVLYFDPARTFDHILNERYRRMRRPVISKIPFNYHTLPESFRSIGAKAVSRIAAGGAARGRGFPCYPVEKSLEALLNALKSCGPAKTSPEKTAFRVVLTHDVDEPTSVKGIPLLASVEREFGLRSAWFAVGKIFPESAAAIAELFEAGNEIGLHDIRHDLRFPYLSENEMNARIESVSSFMKDYGIRGFRSPYYLRSELMFKVLERYFDYDSSVPDADIFTTGVGSGGCALMRPFRKGALVELPVTLPFEIPRLAGCPAKDLVSYWDNKIQTVRACGGVLVVNTHPDAHASGNAEMRSAYRRLIERLVNDGAKFVLPGELLKSN